MLLDDLRGVLRAGSSVLKTWDFDFADVVDPAAVGAYVAEAVARNGEYKTNRPEVLDASRAAARARRQPKARREDGAGGRAGFRLSRSDEGATSVGTRRKPRLAAFQSVDQAILIGSGDFSRRPALTARLPPSLHSPPGAWLDAAAATKRLPPVSEGDSTAPGADWEGGARPYARIKRRS